MSLVAKVPLNQHHCGKGWGLCEPELVSTLLNVGQSAVAHRTIRIELSEGAWTRILLDRWSVLE